jgi:hypothetical protein
MKKGYLLEQISSSSSLNKMINFSLDFSLPPLPTLGALGVLAVQFFDFVRYT